MSTWSDLLTLLWELGEAPRPIAAASKQQGRKGTIFVANCLHRLLLEMWAWDKGLLRDDASLSHWFCCQMSCEFRTDFWASCKPWQISANYVLRDTLCFLCSAGLWQLMQIMWEPNGLQPWILRPPCPPPPTRPQSNYQCNICSTGMMHKEMTSAVTGFGRKRLSEATTGLEALVSVGQCTANRWLP